MPDIKMGMRMLSKAIRSPDLIAKIGSMLFRRRVLVPYNCHLRNGRCPPFDLLHIKLVNACELRCSMCGQWGEAGFHFQKPPAYLKDVLPLDVGMRLMEDAARVGAWISLSGGETFLYPNIIELLTYAKQLGLTVTVATNGLSLNKRYRQLVEIGVDILYVSIDGGKETHDRIRGLKGAFEKTTSGIRALQREKAESRRLKPYVVISAAVTHQNAATFGDVFHVSEDLSVDGMVASFGWFQTEESCNHHEAVMKEKLHTTPTSSRGWLWSFEKIDTENLVKAVGQIRSRKWSFPYAFMPDLADEEIPRYYQEHSNTFGAERCRCPLVHGRSLAQWRCGYLRGSARLHCRER